MTMKLRNRLIALVCLILFLALGAVIFLTKTSRKPFAVILFLGDNITPSSLTATRIFSGGGDGRLHLEDLPNAALCRNAANDYSVPESASASSAIAAGKRVNRGSLCIDPTGKKLPSLLEIAAGQGRSTGLITAGSLTGVTAAAYYAKTLNSQDRTDIFTQFLSHPPIDFVAGGDDIVNSTNTPASSFPDKRALDQLTKKGILVLHSMIELENQPFWKKTPLLGILSQNQIAVTHPVEGDPSAPSLSDLVRVAIRHLQANGQGYFLVVDDPTIASAAAANDAESMFNRIIAFDQAVTTARRYAGDKALILVAGRETIGGPQLNGYPFLRDKGVAVLSLNAQGTPSLCWSTGPGFAPEEKTNSSRDKKSKPSTPGILSQPPAFLLHQGQGVGGDVLSLGVGQGSEKLKGFLDLTDLHQLILEKL